MIDLTQLKEMIEDELYKYEPSDAEVLHIIHEIQVKYWATFESEIKEFAEKRNQL